MTLKPICVRWAFDLSTWTPSFSDLLVATSCVQLEEKTRLAKFIFREDFNASLIGRLLMRKFVNDHTDLKYNNILFDRDARGKPYLKNDVSFHIDFNASHQGSYSLLAGIVQKDTQKPASRVGVDVMKIEYTGGKPLDEFFRLMNRNFSDEEWRFIKRQQTERKNLEAFMRLWCLKESYVKNVGVGITVDLRKISFGVKTDLEVGQIVNDTILRVDDVPQKDYHFEEHLIDTDHCAAVSWLNHPEIIKPEAFKVLSFEEIISECTPMFPSDEDYCRQVEAKEYKSRKSL